MIPKPPTCGRELFWTTNGVADGSADAKHIVAAEAAGVHRICVTVTVDVIVVNLGTDKNVVPEVVTDTGAQVLHEFVLAGVVDAAAKITTGSGEGIVEAGAGEADASERLRAAAGNGRG